MNKKLTIDYLVFVLILIPLLVFPWFVDDPLYSNTLVWSLVLTIPTSIYLGIRKKKEWKKILAGSFVFGVLFGFILEFIANITNTWQEPVIFAPRILGVTTVQSVLFYPVMTFFILVFYDHFFNEEVSHGVSKNIFKAIIPSLFVITLLIYLFITEPLILNIPYAYLILGLLAIVIPIVHSIRKRKLFLRYVNLAFSLFILFFIVEVIGVMFGYWSFPGTDYLALITVFNQTFPVEEIIFWMFFYPATIASYYEEFIDDYF